MNEKANGYGLKVGPKQVEAALATLEAYVAERAALVTDKAKMDLLGSIKLMDALYKFKDEVADRVKSPAEKAYDTLRFVVVPEWMDEKGVPSITVEGVGRCNVTDDVQVKVNAKGGLFEWLTKNEFEDMIQQNVNAQTLAAFVRKRLKAGLPLPDADVMEVKPVTRAAITRS
jgi:hypothetical protein